MRIIWIQSTRAQYGSSTTTMTDYREEQEEEVEALRSIYPEDELKGCNAYLCVPKNTLFL